jgi:SMI1 / KNR4 family (SUKH-1)
MIAAECITIDFGADDFPLKARSLLQVGSTIRFRIGGPAFRKLLPRLRVTEVLGWASLVTDLDLRALAAVLSLERTYNLTWRYEIDGDGVEFTVASGVPLVMAIDPASALTEASSIQDRLADLEKRLDFSFPESHRRAILDPTDPIHSACDFLGIKPGHELLDIETVNKWLHLGRQANCWPAFLFAFASNGCGDYFAYDLRNASPTVIYIDPDLTPASNLAAEDKLTFSNFDVWYVAELSRIGPGRPTSR